jgi:hypothetical protein
MSGSLDAVDALGRFAWRKASCRFLGRDPVSSAAAVGLAGEAARQRSALTADWQAIMQGRCQSRPMEIYYDVSIRCVVKEGALNLLTRQPSCPFLSQLAQHLCGAASVVEICAGTEMRTPWQCPQAFVRSVSNPTQ